MLHIRRGIASILHWLYLRALPPLERAIVLEFERCEAEFMAERIARK